MPPQRASSRESLMIRHEGTSDQHDKSHLQILWLLQFQYTKLRLNKTFARVSNSVLNLSPFLVAERDLQD